MTALEWVTMKATEIGERLSTAFRHSACDLSGHGPFMLATLSTADSSPAPSLYCMYCHIDATHLFHVAKTDGVVLIRATRRDLSIIHAPESEIAIRQYETVEYEAGQFRRTSARLIQ